MGIIPSLTCCLLSPIHNLRISLSGGLILEDNVKGVDDTGNVTEDCRGQHCPLLGGGSGARVEAYWSKGC